MELEVIRSRRKTLSLEVKGDGRVLVRAPLWTSRRQIQSFVDKNGAWIGRQLQKLEQIRAEQPDSATLSREELQQLVNAARRQITARVAYYAPLVGVNYERIAIRKQHTKWGSCSSKGNLNFNCLLMLAPPRVLDYVVVHELCHRIEMNHSPRFWAQVERVMPDYKDSRRWLRDHGAALLAKLSQT